MTPGDGEPIAPEDVHPDFSPEVLQELRRLRADKSGPVYSMDEVFADLGIDLEEIRASRRSQEQTAHDDADVGGARADGVSDPSEPR